MKSRIILMVLALVLSVSGVVACAKKAPQLTPEQLQAGVIGANHPVSQQDATAQGCSCHLQ